MAPRLDAVLFDLDGTLADTGDDLAAALGAAFQDLGVTPSVNITALVDGSPLEELFAVAVPEAPAGLFALFVERYRAHTVQSSFPRSRLYPGVRETLEALGHFRPTLRLAVCTSRRPEAARALTRHLAIDHYFDRVEGTGGTPLRHKPSPDLPLFLARALEVRPERVLFVGDTPRDVRAGRAAGMLTAAVLYGMGEPGALLASGPDHTLEDLLEVLDILGVPSA
ncbi:MAG: HAD family hydrolase [Deltaproteobacteria bacterium]|nr:HAD family hydrolase [Deltaproteobacteria bacterium]